MVLPCAADERVAWTHTLNLANDHVPSELEAFAYSVSNDLRSPLLVIGGSTEMLIDDYVGHIPAGARDIVRNIEAASERMTQLINDLLRLSHLGRQALAKSSVNVAALVREVLA